MITVLFAYPDKIFLKQVKLQKGAKVKEAIIQSGVLNKFPEIELENTKVGIFNKLVELDTELQEGDRVEIYRPLIADPKELRALLAESQRRQALKSK